MLVGPAIRRVAIVGGVRIPFARSYTAYASASNQDMLTAVFRAVVERFKLARRASRRRRRRRRHQAPARLQPGARERAVDRASTRRLPGLTCSAPAARAWRRRSTSATRSRSARSSVGIAGGVDSISDAPIVYPHSYQQLLLAATAAARARAAPHAVVRPAAEALQAGAAGGGRAAHRAVDGAEHGDHGQALADQPHRPGPARLRQPPEGGRRLARRLLRRPGDRVPRPQDRQQRARRTPPSTSSASCARASPPTAP